MRPLALLLFTLAPCLLAEGPEFEVASIKQFVLPNGPVRAGTIGGSGGGPGTADPTHITRSATSLRNVLQSAFDLKPYQILNVDNMSEMFDFALVVPEGATKDDVKIMWRNLLISRFGLKYHIEQREFQVDELLVGPRGHKLVENKDPEPSPAEVSGPISLKMDDQGRPILPRPGLITMLTTNNGAVSAKLVAKAQPVSALATNLSNQLSHPVIDKTGLTGKYDFAVDFTPPGRVGAIFATPPSGAGGAGNTPTPDAAADPGVDLATAVQQQLGLRLVKGKGMLDVVVVDKLEHQPTEN